MKNLKLLSFMLVVCFFVVVFIWHIQSLTCDDSAGFDVSCHKMYMSFGVLFCIGILLLVASGFYVLGDPPATGSDFPAKSVFDSFAKQLIPIATLVLGYYFGTASNPPTDKSEKKSSATAPASSSASEAGRS